MQFDWLLVHHQNMTPEIFLSCIIPHPEHNKIKTDMAESEEAFDRVFEFLFRKRRKIFCKTAKTEVSEYYEYLLSREKV